MGSDSGTAGGRHVLIKLLARLAASDDLEWNGDVRVTVHLLASILRQAEELLPVAIAEARDQTTPGTRWPSSCDRDNA